MHRALPVLLIAAACTPNNLVVTNGSYVAFIADTTSLSLQKGAVNPQDFPVNYNVDCRDGEDEVLLPDFIKICNEENGSWPPKQEIWATQDGFQVVSEPLAPWRGEALITSEGDLQLAFHHRLPGGADTRFIMSIDPDFAPVHCVQTPEGPVREPLDGDWVEAWSGDLDWVAQNLDNYPGAFDHMEPYLDGGRLYYMNAYSFQYDPRNTEARDWDVPEEWTAGAARGKFSEEDVSHRATRYGEPRIYNALAVSGTTETQYQGISVDDLFWCDLEEGADPYTDPCGAASFGFDSMTDLDEHVHQVVRDTYEDLDRLFKPVKSEPAVFGYAPLAHVNYWREPDGLPAGFDGWASLEYNYIVFDKDSVLEEGGRAKGAFSLLLDATLSQTRVFVKGEFEVEKIKKDRWVAPDLPELKLAENDVELCNAASEEDALGDE